MEEIYDTLGAAKSFEALDGGHLRPLALSRDSTVRQLSGRYRNAYRGSSRERTGLDGRQATTRIATGDDALLSSGHQTRTVEGPFYRAKRGFNQGAGILVAQLTSGELWGEHGAYGLEPAAKAHRGPRRTEPKDSSSGRSSRPTTATAVASSGGNLALA